MKPYCVHNQQLWGLRIYSIPSPAGLLCDPWLPWKSEDGLRTGIVGMAVSHKEFFIFKKEKSLFATYRDEDKCRGGVSV